MSDFMVKLISWRKAIFPQWKLFKKFHLEPWRSITRIIFNCLFDLLGRKFFFMPSNFFLNLKLFPAKFLKIYSLLYFSFSFFIWRLSVNDIMLLGKGDTIINRIIRKFQQKEKVFLEWRHLWMNKHSCHEKFP